jgi:hypothetical protein
VSSTVKKVGAARHPTPLSVQPQRKRLSKVYVAVTQLDNGEGIYSIAGPDGQTLPVVAVDVSALAALSEFACQQARLTGRTVSIIGFTKRTHRETFRPPATGDKK